MPDDTGPAEADVSGAMSDSENEYEDTDGHLKDEDEKMTEQNVTADGLDGNGEAKKKYDPKDPLRPRRKKARRACYACQRAHLTCGDERPCQRCIKRGLADACQDGVRKKAKYLHDAPPEALRPVLGPNYDPNAPVIRPNGHRHPSNSGSEVSSNVGTFFSQSNASQYPVFSSAQSALGSLPENMPFGSQQSPVSPSFQTHNPQMGGMPVPQVSSPMTTFPPAIFDPQNPLYSFNLEGINFGSQYGAMEFGILGQMSMGAGETPPRDPSLSQQGSGDVYGPPGMYGNGLNPLDKMYDNGVIPDFLGLDPNGNGMYQQGNLQHGLPHAYAIAAGPTSLQSPSTENNSPQPTPLGLEGSPTVANNYTGPAPSGGQQQTSIARPKSKTPALARIGPQGILGKRNRDPSYIYETVKDPFPYVESFHRVINMLKNRFSREKVLRIAKSLATIRPSFISCTKTLNRQDLVFMEKSFQRALFEYEEFMHQCSSPALACRRTGEVAGVNKEFTALTGWTKDVLLGKEPNLNVNTGILPPGSSNSSTSGKPGLSTTPMLRAMESKMGDGQPRPVFLFELMDDESVIDFYEDYAQLAFNNSRGKVVRKCRLLKYRTKENVESAAGTDIQEESPQKDMRNSILSNRVAKIDGEHGISKLERDGKLECSYTWTIKRDTFDIPMMIVVNFLPCYYRNHNQLAV
ncbi:transcription activator of gluconeogenesis [Immersiella caudata]|uniref:Transcription activator of gluconeogenesis n=1 Tax=Immersiella caudata TaxID=314043 RepID=A0AA39WL04_9PEZI|nr:transcription activator of gluconeogenesis [Immersiella caudata]